MPDFQYIAREFSGRQVTGVLTAHRSAEAVGMLSAQRLFPVQVRPAEPVQARANRQARRVPAGKLASFYSQLADLLRAGVPLLRSLELLQRQTASGSGAVQSSKMSAIEVADGTRLADAMRPIRCSAI